MLAGPRTKGACVATGHKVWGILNARATGEARISYGDIHVGTIARCVGNPGAAPGWQWRCSLTATRIAFLN
jgi:hypothetical protein